MGFAKDQMIAEDEKYSQGYHIPEDNDKYVCYELFDNIHLAKYIKDHGKKGICSYTGKKSTVMKFRDFMDYVCSRITSYIGPINQEDLPLASNYTDDDDDIPGLEQIGCYIVPETVEHYESTSEIMFDYELETKNTELNEDIENCFNDDFWIRKEPMELLLHEDLIYSWQHFCSLVKNKIRYTFFRYDKYYQDIQYEDFKGRDIVQEVSDIVKLLEYAIPTGTILYRGRPEDKNAPFTEFKQLTAPPAEYAKSNRMSAYGISMFYGSFEQETPIKEIRNYLEDINKKIYLGRFKTKRELKVINLCDIPSPNFWMEEKEDWQKYTFLHLFHKEISQPTGNKDKELEYIPTQVFTEYLRYIQKTKDGKQYDGIMYKSSLTKGKNLVLFYDNETSAKILELEKIL